MKLKFYGTRGSIPVCGQEFLEFGGNTSSIKITREDGRISILDAGTGIRNLGKVAIPVLMVVVEWKMIDYVWSRIRKEG